MRTGKDGICHSTTPIARLPETMDSLWRFLLNIEINQYNQKV